LHATTEGKKDLNPSQPNTAHRVSESFFALSMSVTLNGNSTVHSASAEFQTNSAIHPRPITHQVLCFPLYKPKPTIIYACKTKKNKTSLYIPSCPFTS